MLLEIEVTGESIVKTKTILNLMRSKCNKNNSWMVDNIQYLTLMGSHAYGTHHKDSDFDVYGFTIPPKEYIYPGHINGFDSPPVFDQFQGQIEGKTKSECLDFQIYNISKYFRLVMENNPNMLDSLFTRPNCELIITDLARKVKNNRTKFLHKGMWRKFKGYAFSQLNKAKNKKLKLFVEFCKKHNIPTNVTLDDVNNEIEGNKEGETILSKLNNNNNDLNILKKLILEITKDGKISGRLDLVEKYGYDTKFSTNLFRLLNEVEQLLNTGDMDLMQNREQLKRVLQGYYTLDEVIDYFKRNEARLEQSYENSKLPYGVNDIKDDVRGLLVECLDNFYYDELVTDYNS